MKGGNAYFCKYLYSSPTTNQCQSTQTNQFYFYGQLMISDISFFFVGFDKSIPTNLFIYKTTFAQTTPDWCYKMLWPQEPCASSDSESILISSTIYSFYIYGYYYYMYFATFSVTTGSILNSRYKSSMRWNYITRISMNGDFIVVATSFPSSDYLMSFNTKTNEIKFWSFKNSISGMVFESTGR